MRGVADGLLTDGADRVHAPAVLRMLGLPPDEAEETARAPLSLVSPVSFEA